MCTLFCCVMWNTITTRFFFLYPKKNSLFFIGLQSIFNGSLCLIVKFTDLYNVSMKIEHTKKLLLLYWWCILFCSTTGTELIKLMNWHYDSFTCFLYGKTLLFFSSSIYSNLPFLTLFFLLQQHERSAQK